MRRAARNPREVIFRLQQTVENAAIWAFPPHLKGRFQPTALNLSDPGRVRERLENTAFGSEIVELADGIFEHRWPLLGALRDFGRDLEWRRDYPNGKTSGLAYFRFVPYLDFQQVGDHKNVWELNRHQHLVVLAQAHLLTGKPAYRDEIAAQLESWWVQNPFLRGINWASALEVAFRALSWLWIDHLVGESLEPGLRGRLWNSLYQHGAFLKCNLSTYFSPNTHLLGEAVALHAIGIRLNRPAWRHQGARIVDQELRHQIAGDGSHFEQSTYYHVYALDMFLFHYVLAGHPESYQPVLLKMARFLAGFVGPERLLTFLGDDDGGRFFHPYGAREDFARATLATCAMLFPEERFPLDREDLEPQAEWWLGPKDAEPRAAEPAAQLFPDAGLASIASGEIHVLVDAGPFGFGGAGHSHADTLSITARRGKQELLIDPGTFTYVADPLLRREFRGTAFHNTIRIDGLDQATQTGPFRWEGKPAASVKQWMEESGLTYLDAVCRYRGFEHRRRVLVVEDQWLFVLDEVNGPAGEHRIEQFWHVGDRSVPLLLSDPGAAEWQDGLRSRVLGQKEPAPVLCAQWNTTLPHICGAALYLGSGGTFTGLQRDGRELSVPGAFSVVFPESGMPSVRPA